MGDDEPASPPSGALTDNHPRPQSRRWSSPSSPERRERCSPAHTPARDGRGRRRRRPSPLARASREVPAQVLSHFLAVENRNHYRANSCQLLGYLFKTTIIDAQDSNFMINNHSIMIFIKQRYFVFPVLGPTVGERGANRDATSSNSHIQGGVDADGAQGKSNVY